MMRCMGHQPRADLLSSHDKGQEREEPYEATSLTYGSEAAAGRATEPPTVTSSPPGIRAGKPGRTAAEAVAEASGRSRSEGRAETETAEPVRRAQLA